MEDRFFTHLDGDAVRGLLARAALRDAALVTVGRPSSVEDCNRAAAADRPAPARTDRPAAGRVRCKSAARLHCIAFPCTVYEELDGVSYRLEILPHRDGALLAFLREDRALLTTAACGCCMRKACSIWARCWRTPNRSKTLRWPPITAAGPAAVPPVHPFGLPATAADRRAPAALYRPGGAVRSAAEKAVEHGPSMG